MIVTPEQCLGYLKPFSDSCQTIAPGLQDKLERWKRQEQRKGLSPLEHLFIEHHIGKKSLNYLSAATAINENTLKKLFGDYGLPTRTRAEAIAVSWEDPDMRQNHRASMRKKFEEPGYRKRQAAGTQRHLEKKWADEKYRQQKSDEMKQRWEHDSAFRERTVLATRQSRLQTNLRQLPIRTIKGERKDIGYAQSTWEANLARIFTLLGQPYSTHVRYDVAVPEDDQDLFGKKDIATSIDFIVQRSSNRNIGYEIIAHPTENSKDLKKTQYVTTQHGIPVRIITERAYHRLQKRFKDRISKHQTLAGWEIPKRNLRTHPDIYGKRS